MKNGTAVTMLPIAMRQFGALMKMVASSQCDYVTQSNWSQFILAEPIEKWKYIAKINEEDEQRAI